MKFSRVVMAAAAVCAVAGCVRPDGSKTTAVKVSSFGYDAADSTRFLQAAFDSGAEKVIIDRQAGDWITRPLFLTNSNVEVVLEDGVNVVAKRGCYYGRNDCLFTIKGGAKNVILRGEGKATLRMHKADYLDPAQKYPFAEWRMGVNILRSRHVAVKNLTILSSGGDGVYVGGGARDVLLEDLDCRDHNRQGISITDAVGCIARRCHFDNTYGAAPQCGVDIEPNKERDHATDIVFEDCTFDGNAAHGFDMHLGCFTARTQPISIVYRRCVARGNKGCGISFMTGSPKFVMERGHVKGTVLFEDCAVSGNGGEAVKIINHMADGLDLSFRGCTFDARGAHATSAILLTNAQLLKDLGGITFENCRVFMDKGCKVCEFEAQEGIGIGGALKGVAVVECDGKASTFSFPEFAARHVPHPERVTVFKSPMVDYKALPIVPAAKLKGAWLPPIRRAFVFVQTVPAAGDYPVTFRSHWLRKDAGRTAKSVAPVQLLDRAGTDLGRFDLPEGDFTYTIHAKGPGVYRFEVANKNGSTVSVRSTTPGGALLADRPINLFHGRNVTFHFRVPAAAKDVQVYLQPEEAASAVLFDATGRTVAEMPHQTKLKRFTVPRSPTAKDEIWTLKFPQVDEDFKFQVGGGAMPLLSVEKAGVIR